MGGGAVLAIVVIVLLVVLLVVEERERCHGTERIGFSEFWLRGNALLGPYNQWIRAAALRPSRPIYAVDDLFPESQILRQNWSKIRDEALSIVRAGLDQQIHHDVFFNRIADDKWTRFHLRWLSQEFEPEARAHAPITVGLLSQLPQITIAMFSIMKPHSKVKPHRGLFAGALRYHLGLQCPTTEGCEITVDGQKYQWRDGHDVLFDDTYVHSVENNTDETRVILFCDVERPLRGKLAQRLNSAVCKKTMYLMEKLNSKQEKSEKSCAM